MMLTRKAANEKREDVSTFTFKLAAASLLRDFASPFAKVADFATDLTDIIAYLRTVTPLQ